MKNRFFIILLFFFGSLAASEKMTLDDCVRSALSESETIKSAQAGLDSAEFQKSASFTKLFPTITLDYQYLKFFYAPALNNDHMTLDGLTMNNPVPNEAPIAVPYITPSQLDMAPQRQNSLSITASQPITPLWSAVKAYSMLDIMGNIAELKHSLSKDQVREGVIEYYYGYFMFQHSIELMEETVKQFELYEKNAQNLVDAGVSDRRAVLKFRIERTGLEKEIVNMRGMMNLTKMGLAQLMNKSENSFELAEDSFSVVPVKASAGEALTLQDQYRKDMKLLGRTVEIQDKLVDIALQPFIPTVVLSTGYKKDFENRTGAFFLGGILSFNLVTDWVGNYNSFKQAKADRIKAQFDMIDTKKKMQLQVKSLMNDITVKEKEIELAKVQIDEAAENLRIEESKYKERLTTETDLLTANLSQRKARTSFLTASYQYMIAANKLAFTIGVELKEITGGN